MKTPSSRPIGHGTLLILALAALAMRARAADAPHVASPEERAVAYLAQEVPRWSPDHNCRSCHNNGDAARALLQAQAHGFAFEPSALSDTLDWLSHPEQWEHNGGDQEFSDKQLAALQFAAALAAATPSNPSPEQQTSLVAAARLVAQHQQEDGDWRTIAPGSIGSSITWGRFLATSLARRTLARAPADEFESSLARADAWLGSETPRSVLDAGSLLIGLAGRTDDAANRQRTAALALIRQGEADEGGWGPFVTSATEPFDTAVVLIGLSLVPPSSEVDAWTRRGRAALIAQQQNNGSWPETTRPAGNISYAQRISTTAWATMALVTTAPPQP